MSETGGALGAPRWAWPAVGALILVLAATGFASGISNIARSAGLLRDLARPDAFLTQVADTPPGWLEVVTVVPGGAADNAGMRPGDRIRVGPGGTCCRANVPVAVTIERDGTLTDSEIVATRSAFAAPALLSLGGAGTLLATIFALVLLVRGRNIRAAALLGLVLLSFTVSKSPSVPWSPNETILIFWQAMDLSGTAVYAYLWPLFALAVSGGASSVAQLKLVKGGALFAALLVLSAGIAAMIPAYIPIFGSPTNFDLAFLILHQGFGYAIIARNYRRNDAAARNRIKIVVGAFVCLMLSALLAQVMRVLVSTGQYTQDQAFWIVSALNLLTFAAIALLAYAVLRQKLFDLNFALNRTLVYGTVSLVLLTAFGGAKWVIEHLIPPAWHDGSEYYSFGIALALFLSLHRVHNWVEKRIERLLFSSWHQNEAALRRFVSAAGHFDSSQVLCRAFAQELSRFAGGAGAALYLIGSKGAYRLSTGRLAGARKSCARDDRALALMRVEREPVKLVQAHSSLPGELALPMFDQERLAGFVLLGRKGDGTDYRPDEIEALGWAAHQIGLDLQAMHARELAAEVAELNAKVSSLSEERDRLSGLLAEKPRRRRAGNGTKQPLPA